MAQRISRWLAAGVAGMALAVGAASAADVPADALAEAIGLYGRGETAAARQAFEALSRQGVAAADYNLALMHLNGDLPGGPAEARRLMVRAAQAGFVTAMLALGRLHEEGRLGARDLPQSLAWYLHAAHAGSVDAQVAAGTAYYLGRGTAQDMALAAQWYRAAAVGGDVGAQYLIASMLETGLGVARDLRLARYWYDVAARNGDEAAPDKVRELDERLKGAADCQREPEPREGSDPGPAARAPPSPSGAC